MDPTSPIKFPRQFLAALSLRSRSFYEFLRGEYKTDADALLRRAEEQLRDISPTITPQ
jgi:hypothetical protein